MVNKRIFSKLFTELMPQNPQLNNGVYKSCTAPEPANQSTSAPSKVWMDGVHRSCR